jgi:hypothetical protein
MKKTAISVEYDEEKLKALQHFLKQKECKDIKDKMIDIFDMEDPYLDELTAIFDSTAHTEEKREDFVFGRYDPKDSSKKFDRLVVAKQHKQDEALLNNIKDIKDELER